MKIKGLTVGNGLTETEPNTFKIDTTLPEGVKVMSGTIECIDHKETINKALKLIDAYKKEAFKGFVEGSEEERLDEFDQLILASSTIRQIEEILKGEM